MVFDTVILAPNILKLDSLLQFIINNLAFI